MNRSLFITLAVLLSSLGLPGSASAQRQGFALDRFHAPPSVTDGLRVQLPSALAHLDWSGALTLDYAHRPLAASPVDAPGGAEQIVQGSLVGHLTFAIGLFDRFEAFATLPLVAQWGDSPNVMGDPFDTPGSFSLGDLAVGGSVELLGGTTGPKLAVAASLSLPSGQDDDLAGDGGVGARGALLAAYVHRHFTVALDVGAAYRPEREYGSATIGSELTVGAGVHVPITDRLRAMLELDLATRLGDAFNDLDTPAEALAGARYEFRNGVHVGGGVSLGITDAPGVPTFRALATVGYAPPHDMDRDGYRDGEDGCPGEPEDFDDFEDADGCPDEDNDADGVLDVDDDCPMVPEDVDEFADSDGCPDPDNDEDGLLDEPDQCPDEAEDRDGFDDDDGCPDPDNDGDSILDEPDQCRDAAEDLDGFEDDDGCPDPDNDGDAILDGDDSCPLRAETVNGFEDADGCPDEVVVTDAAIELPAPIQFAFDRDVILEVSFPILEQVRVILEERQSMELSLEGHTSSEGSPDHNLRLSRLRARAVRRWLTQHGIDRSRLRASGFGGARPTSDNGTEAGREANRRVEFVIVGAD